MSLVRSSKSRLNGVLFLLPLLGYVAIYFAYPWLYNIIISFKETTLASFVKGTSPFIGLGNYTAMLRESAFWRATVNTAVFTIVSMSFQFTIGLCLALFFNRSFPLDKILRGLLMIPFFLPLIVTGGAVRWFFSGAGTVNSLLLASGLISESVNWLTDPSTVIWVVTLVNIWIGIPFYFVLLHTGIRGIPSQLYEAASIDGATRLQQLIHITIPVIRPVIFVVLMLATAYTVRHFDIVWITTQGGPGNASHLFSTLSYDLSFRQYQFGIGTAISNVMVAIVICLTAMYFLLLGREK